MIDITNKPTNIISTTQEEIIISYDRDKETEIFDNSSPRNIASLFLDGQEYFVKYTKAYHSPDKVKAHFEILKENVIYIHLKSVYLNGKLYDALSVKDKHKSIVIAIKPTGKTDILKDLQNHNEAFKQATHYEHFLSQEITQIKSCVQGGYNNNHKILICITI
jgi:hypothetical protein